MRVILEAYANRGFFIHTSNTYKNELEAQKSIDTNIRRGIVLQERGICLQIWTMMRKCLYVNQVNVQILKRPSGFSGGTKCPGYRVE